MVHLELLPDHASTTLSRCLCRFNKYMSRRGITKTFIIDYAKDGTIIRSWKFSQEIRK